MLRVVVGEKTYTVEFHRVRGTTRMRCWIRDTSTPSPGDGTFPVVAKGLSVSVDAGALLRALSELDDWFPIFRSEPSTFPVLDRNAMKERRRSFWEAYSRNRKEAA